MISRAAFALLAIVASATLGSECHAAASKPLRVGGAVKAPRVIHREEVTYPAATRDGIYPYGILVLEAVVTKTGTVRNVRVVGGPKNENSAAVIAAVEKWKFSPATLRGVPVDVVFNLSVNHFPAARAPN